MTIVTFEEGDESPKVRYTDNGDGSYTPIVDASLSAGNITVSGSVAVTSLPSLPAGANSIGSVAVLGVLSTDTAPATNAFAITGNDNANLAHDTRGIFVAGAGTLKATFTDSGTVVISGLSAGVIYPFAVEKVFSIGTTASGLIGLY